MIQETHGVFGPPGAELVGRQAEAFDAEAEFWQPLLDHGRKRAELRDDLDDREIIRWLNVVQFMFLERSEFFEAPDAVRDYAAKFIVPALLSTTPARSGAAAPGRRSSAGTAR